MGYIELPEKPFILGEEEETVVVVFIFLLAFVFFGHVMVYYQNGNFG